MDVAAAVTDTRRNRFQAKIDKLPDPLITATLDRLSGESVFAGARVPVKNLFDYLEGGDPLEDILIDFPNVSRAHAVAVLELARSKVTAEAA